MDKFLHGINNNKGKFVVIVLYALVVFIMPFASALPYSQAQQKKLLNEVIVNQKEKEVFKAYIDSLRSGDVDMAMSYMSAEGKQKATKDSMRGLANYFTNATDQMEIVGGSFNIRKTTGTTTGYYLASYEIVNDDPVYKFVVADIEGQDLGNGIEVSDTHVATSTVSLKELGKLDFASQGMYLLFSLLVPFLIIYTALRYLAMAKSPSWWIFLVILLLSLYIHTSSQGVTVNFGFYGFMSKVLWAPWTFATPIPLGVIYYFIRRKHYEGGDQA